MYWVLSIGARHNLIYKSSGKTGGFGWALCQIEKRDYYHCNWVRSWNQEPLGDLNICVEWMKINLPRDYLCQQRGIRLKETGWCGEWLKIKAQLGRRQKGRKLKWTENGSV